MKKNKHQNDIDYDGEIDIVEPPKKKKTVKAKKPKDVKQSKTSTKKKVVKGGTVEPTVISDSNNMNIMMSFATFNREVTVPDNIKKYFSIEDDKLTQIEITKLIYEYIKEKDLINKKNRNEINIDDVLRNGLHLHETDKLNFVNLQRHVSKQISFQSEIKF